MKPSPITPLILGRGRAGQAIAHAFNWLKSSGAELAEPRFVARGTNWEEACRGVARPLACIANPHGLHTKALLEVAGAGIGFALCEKPAAVTMDELAKLRDLPTRVGILHGYRQSWGVAKLKELLDSGALGRLVAIEGRYWQASAAERALNPSPQKTWKDDPALSGPFDTYLDLGTHWVDAASFLAGAAPEKIRAFRSIPSGSPSHRDAHVQLSIHYPHLTAMASVSKLIHGAGNHFEINLLGEAGTATWNFERPDEIRLGHGREMRLIRRLKDSAGSGLPPFHGLGWLEGYVAIASGMVAEMNGVSKGAYPTLPEHLRILRPMLDADWI
ncbi:MAG: Gfo/Idh/MocA family oxidoreductase [Proteobacteria bacterium]|nr:MAG: Gfo/Idh/MocA family oxidoreductase [Pseudomonadota bacterium]